MINVLVRNSTGEIVHQDADYTLNATRIKVEKDDEILFYFGDLNEDTATVQVLESAIDPWIGNKYIYNDGTPIINPDYVEPEIEE